MGSTLSITSKGYCEQGGCNAYIRSFDDSWFNFWYFNKKISKETILWWYEFVKNLDPTINIQLLEHESTMTACLNARDKFVTGTLKRRGSYADGGYSTPKAPVSLVYVEMPKFDDNNYKLAVHSLARYCFWREYQHIPIVAKRLQELSDAHNLKYDAWTIFRYAHMYNGYNSYYGVLPTAPFESRTLNAFEERKHWGSSINNSFLALDSRSGASAVGIPHYAKNIHSEKELREYLVNITTAKATKKVGILRTLFCVNEHGKINPKYRVKRFYQEDKAKHPKTGFNLPELARLIALDKAIPKQVEAITKKANEGFVNSIMTMLKPLIASAKEPPLKKHKALNNLLMKVGYDRANPYSSIPTVRIEKLNLFLRTKLSLFFSHSGIADLVRKKLKDFDLTAATKKELDKLNK
jgi:hypothetical protein